MPTETDKPGTKPSVEGKHSPGPWRTCAASHGKCSCGIIWDASGEWAPAKVWQDNDELGACVEPERAWADARLIAAAPEMLELLQRWHDHETHSSGVPTGLLLDTAALLARIEGEG